MPETSPIPTFLRDKPSPGSAATGRSGTTPRAPRARTPRAVRGAHAVRMRTVSLEAPSPGLAGRTSPAPLHTPLSTAALAARLQQARDAERAALARELHDELGALLTAARLDVAWLETQPGCREPAVAQRLEALRGLLSEGIDFKRRVVEELHPSLLMHLGLQCALQRLLEDSAARFAGRITAQLDDTSALDDGRALALYRVVQEALTNILKYAHASTVRIRLECIDGQAHLTVADDGQGFDPHEVGPGHHGLTGMRDRLLAVGGQLEVNAAPGRGTVLYARVALPTPVTAPPMSRREPLPVDLVTVQPRTTVRPPRRLRTPEPVSSPSP